MLDDGGRENRDRLARAWAAAAAAADNGGLQSSNAMGLQLHSPLDVSFASSQAAAAAAAAAQASNHATKDERLAPPMLNFENVSTAHHHASPSALGITAANGGPLLSPANFDNSSDFSSAFGSAFESGHGGNLSAANTPSNLNMDQLSTQEWMDQLLQSVGVSGGSLDNN